MSYVQRRRFLWILFLWGLALLAVAAGATTLAQAETRGSGPGSHSRRGRIRNLTVAIFKEKLHKALRQENP
jgi:hypothetical protein